MLDDNNDRGFSLFPTARWARWMLLVLDAAFLALEGCWLLILLDLDPAVYTDQARTIGLLIAFLAFPHFIWFLWKESGIVWRMPAATEKTEGIAEMFIPPLPRYRRTGVVSRFRRARITAA